ncbi:MAG: hypothetical protein OXT71_05090 [Acidobacteriota bacterium]|nr:hypothetical protein [Acidobacteriota bacterium]
MPQRGIFHIEHVTVPFSSGVVSRVVGWGVPVPAISSALAFYDGYRQDWLPANLLQSQRVYFGAHTYERVDRPRGEFFHTRWLESG